MEDSGEGEERLRVVETWEGTQAEGMGQMRDLKEESRVHSQVD